MPLAPLLWGTMLAYGAIMMRAAPLARTIDEFYRGRSREGREIGKGVLVATVVISWIFAKSITNAANLGESFGFVGAVAYAGWYLSIPVAGVVIYLLRTRLGVESLGRFLELRHGRAAALSFLLVVLIRLLNEVWSNTAVVGAYFGASGTTAYFAGALSFTAITLAYGVRGGLRGSILTDLLQFGLGVFFLVLVLAILLPRTGMEPLVSSGHWTLAGGVDLLLVALIQSFSYPFHDPVLTDRAFITRPAVMLRAYVIAGLVAGAFIALFGLTGVYARVAGIAVGQDAPLRVAHAFGVAMTAAMTLLMMVSAGSTLDSTFSSVARAAAFDLGGGTTPAQRDAPPHSGAIRLGRWAMVGTAVLGSIPLFTGAAIIKATTVSGTMVLGLAPPFLLFAWRRARGLSFHMGFWPGVGVGLLHALNRIPAGWSIGTGPNAALLGANVVGTLACFGGFVLGAFVEPLFGMGGAARSAATPGLPRSGSTRA
jgi:solute:Na+ symporter, SSS family